MKASFTLRDLPQDERPRERLMQLGVDALSSQELLTIILGRGIQGESVVVTVQKLLSHFGSLTNLRNASIEDLMSIKGIGVAKACQLLACFAISKRTEQAKINRGDSELIDVARLLQKKIGEYTKEHFVVVSFNSRMRVIGSDIIAIGTLSTNLVHPREIFEAAIRRHAASILIAHNHPSGNSSPSDDDLFVTKQLIEAGNLFGIPVVDHFILTSTHFYSLQNDKEVRL